MRVVVLLLMFLSMLRADENVVKVVFDLTTGDLKNFERQVLSGIAVHKTHYEGTLKELEVAVVIHGNAYKFFVKDAKHPHLDKEKALREVHAALSKRIASMADTYDVKFFICRSGMRAKKLEEEDIYDFVEIIPTSTIGLIDKQNEGFAYIPI